MSITPENWLLGRFVSGNILLNGLSQNFAHYSSTENIINILNSQHIWLKKTSTMNDLSEVEWGTNLVKDYFFNCQADGFWGTIDHIKPNLSSRVKEQLEYWYEDLFEETYIFCLTEFIEDYGRLSMWRGYGAGDTSAIVINRRFFQATQNPYGLLSTPVFYFPTDKIVAFFRRFEVLAKQHSHILHLRNEEQIIEALLGIFKTICFSFKHPGFSEEKEVRIVYRPSEATTKKLTIPENGDSQFRALPISTNLHGVVAQASIQECLNHILIGPIRLADKKATKLNFSKLLRKYGFDSPEDLIKFSDIPLRS